MATLLHTNIRGEQIDNATISGVHIVNASIAPIKADVYNSPSDGDVLTYKDATGQFEWNSIGTMTVNESPTGSINGANTTFTLTDTPVGNTLSVFLNGILQQPGLGNDYTVSGDTITFTAAPETGDIILCSYLISSGLGGGVYTDHGNLDGLGDDDHPQYILVDGSRAFTGVVAGVTPTLPAHLSTKGYVDDSLTNQTHAASDITSGTFADARIAQSNVTQHVAALNHNLLLNTHNLTTDINHNTLLNYSIDQHRVINDSSTAVTDLWSASKISSEITTATGSLSSNEISQGDSYVRVTDVGPNSIVDFVLNGTNWTTFSGNGEIRLGLSNSYVKITPGDATVDFHLNDTDFGMIGSGHDGQRLGTTSSHIKNVPNDNTFDIVQDGTNVAHFASPDDSATRIGPSSNAARLELDNTGDPTQARLYGGDDNYLEIEQDVGGGFTLKYYENNNRLIEVDAYAMHLGNNYTYAYIDYDSDRFDVYSDSTRVLRAQGTGVQLTSGAVVNEFSTDGTLSGNSDTAIPTEKAVKTYVDTGADKIAEGNSKVEVVDTGTGYVTVEVDGSETTRFNPSNVTVAADILPEMTGASGTVSTRDIGSSSAKFNNIYCHDLLADAGSIYVNNKKVIEDVSDVITISTDTGQRLKLETTGDAGDVYIEGQGGIQFHIPNTSSNKDITFSNESPSGQINIGGSGQTVKFTGAVDITAGTLSHSDLTNLTADDHAQYVLANGTRAFTGVVAGITPTADAHLTTKGYVDGLTQGLDWQDSVKDRDLTAPPGSPTTGDRYIVASSATGAWAGHDGDTAEYNGSGWDFVAKSEGMAVWVEDEDVLYTYNGSSWVKFGSTITHNNTIGLQGGTSNEYYHLTSAQKIDLTSGGNSVSHKHDDRYYTETELDAGQLDNRYYTESEVDTISGALNTKIDAAGHSSESEYITISSDDITNKYTVLSHTPFAVTEVMMDVVGGCAQIYSVDFTVSNTHLSWSGLALDGVLESGDIIRVYYTYDA